MTAAVPSSRRRMRILRRPTEAIRPASPRAQRRDCHGRLGTALLALAGAGTSFSDAGFRPWCSATFIGAQHRFTLFFNGADAAARADAFAERLAAAEFVVTGHIVADATLDALHVCEDGAVLADVAALTVEDW